MFEENLKQHLVHENDGVIVSGIITDITNTASNGRFTATIEFDNDGDIKLGMTINITV